METKYYEYIGTQKQADNYHADNYAEPIPIMGNIYSSNEKIGGEKVSFWLISTSLAKEWRLVEKELSTEELIELLNKKAAKDGMTCLVTFQKKPGIEITDFSLDFADKDDLASVCFCVNLGILQIAVKKPQLIEAIKNVLEND
jgi:hypothetical protein